MASRFKTLFKRKSSTGTLKPDSTPTSTAQPTKEKLNKKILDIVYDEKKNDPEKKNSKVERVGKTCRVYFSSPFEGLEEEIQVLNEKYFPLLRKICDKNGVVFYPVMLKWDRENKVYFIFILFFNKKIVYFIYFFYFTLKSYRVIEINKKNHNN